MLYRVDYVTKEETNNVHNYAINVSIEDACLMVESLYSGQMIQDHEPENILSVIVKPV